MIYITGDVHGDITRFGDKRLRKLRKGDSLIICGDFGLIWDGSDKEKRLLKRLGKRRYNILFVEGAHENFEELEKYETETWNGGETRKISGNLRQLKAGGVFSIDGRKIFAFGGGAGEKNGGEAPCDEKIRMKYEAHSADVIGQADKALSECGNSVDYVVSYTPPLSIAEFICGSEAEADTAGTYLERKKNEIGFTRWFFGKHHITKLIPTRFMGVFNTVIDAETLK